LKIKKNPVGRGIDVTYSPDVDKVTAVKSNKYTT